jgi:hypothetical protein
LFRGKLRKTCTENITLLNTTSNGGVRYQRPRHYHQITVVRSQLQIAGGTQRDRIDAVLRKQVWEHYLGDVLTITFPWCRVDQIKAFSFESGHVEAAARGGRATLSNLRPICSSCNRSMGANRMDLRKYKPDMNRPGFPHYLDNVLMAYNAHFGIEPEFELTLAQLEQLVTMRSIQ